MSPRQSRPPEPTRRPRPGSSGPARGGGEPRQSLFRLGLVLGGDGEGLGLLCPSFSYAKAGRGDGRGKGNRSYLLLRDVKLIPLQNHITVFPDFPKNAFPAKFPYPADLLRLRRLLVSILLPLTQREREENGGKRDYSGFYTPPPLPLCPTFASPSRRPLSPPGLGLRWCSARRQRFSCADGEATATIPGGRCRDGRQGWRCVI